MHGSPHRRRTRRWSMTWTLRMLRQGAPRSVTCKHDTPTTLSFSQWAIQDIMLCKHVPGHASICRIEDSRRNYSY